MAVIRSAALRARLRRLSPLSLRARRRLRLLEVELAEAPDSRRATSRRVGDLARAEPLLNRSAPCRTSLGGRSSQGASRLSSRRGDRGTAARRRSAHHATSSSALVPSRRPAQLATPPAPADGASECATGKRFEPAPQACRYVSRSRPRHDRDRGRPDVSSARHRSRACSVVAQPAEGSRRQDRAVRPARADPLRSTSRWPARLPLSTVETYSGGSGSSVRVSYQLKKWPR